MSKEEIPLSSPRRHNAAPGEEGSPLCSPRSKPVCGSSPRARFPGGGLWHLPSAIVPRENGPREREAQGSKWLLSAPYRFVALIFSEAGARAGARGASPSPAECGAVPGRGSSRVVLSLPVAFFLPAPVW